MTEISTFRDAVLMCWNTPEFMSQYRRLTGNDLWLDPRTPIERMIDEACGVEPELTEEWRRFFAFVRDVVWLPLFLPASRMPQQKPQTADAETSDGP